MKFSLTQLLGLIGIPLVVAVGQILFKMTAVSAAGRGLTGLLTNATFWIAIIIYGAATIAWIPTIASIPISRAYLFMALTFLYVPILSTFMLGERVSVGVIVGVVMVIAGILVSVWS